MWLSCGKFCLVASSSLSAHYFTVFSIQVSLRILLNFHGVKETTFNISYSRVRGSAANATNFHKKFNIIGARTLSLRYNLSFRHRRRHQNRNLCHQQCLLLQWHQLKSSVVPFSWNAYQLRVVGSSHSLFSLQVFSSVSACPA